MLQALLPPGAAWTRETGATLTRLLEGLAEELARIDARCADLLREADPRTTAELISEWERITGLPDPCTGPYDTLQERRSAIVSQLTDAGGQSPAYFIALALTLGYTITVEDGFQPFRVGLNSVGDALNGADWAYVWRVNAPETTVRTFAVGQSTVGEQLRTWGNELLECVLTRRKPAHTHILFSYGG
jgi:uncharacterized protein YmfQ (DUF2313 family)